MAEGSPHHGLADGLPTPVNSFYDPNLPPRDSHGNRPGVSQGVDRLRPPSQFQVPAVPNENSPADLLEAIPESVANDPPPAAPKKKKGKGKVQVHAASKPSKTAEEMLEAIPGSSISQGSEAGGESSTKLHIPAKNHPSKSPSKQFETIPDASSSHHSQSTEPPPGPSGSFQVQVPPKQKNSKTPSQLFEVIPEAKTTTQPSVQGPTSSRISTTPAKLKSALKPPRIPQTSHSHPPADPQVPPKPQPGRPAPARHRSPSPVEDDLVLTIRGHRLKSRPPTPPPRSPPHERRAVTIISPRASQSRSRSRSPSGQGSWKHHRIEDASASDLLRSVIRRIESSDMSKLWDRILVADKAGAVSDSEYLDIQCFFYRFLPMILTAPENDPVTVSMSELQRHERVLDLWEGRMTEGVVQARAAGMRARGEGRVGGHGMDKYSRPRNNKGWKGVDYWEARDRREQGIRTTRQRDRSRSKERKKGFFRR